GKPYLTGRTGHAPDLRDRLAGRPRGVAHRRHHRRVPGQARPPRRTALGVRRRGRGCAVVHGSGRPASGDLAEPAAASAGGSGERHRRHCSSDGDLHGRLDETALARSEGSAGGRAATSALAVGSGFALVAMAFLAVMREGFETVVFLLAAFNESSSGSLAGLGALVGIVVAVALGYGIYRG